MFEGEREREREIRAPPLPVHSANAYKGWLWARPNLGTGSSIQGSHVGSRNPIPEASLLPPKVCVRRKLEEEPETSIVPSQSNMEGRLD